MGPILAEITHSGSRDPPPQQEQQQQQIENGGGLFTMMQNIYDSRYDSRYHNNFPTDSEHLRLYILVKHCFSPIIKRQQIAYHVEKTAAKKRQEQADGVTAPPSAAAAAVGAGAEGEEGASAAAGAEEEVEQKVPEPGPLENWLMAPERRSFWLWTINAISVRASETRTEHAHTHTHTLPFVFRSHVGVPRLSR